MLDFMQIRSKYANEEYANELICKLSVIFEKCGNSFHDAFIIIFMKVG